MLEFKISSLLGVYTLPEKKKIWHFFYSELDERIREIRREQWWIKDSVFRVSVSGKVSDELTH